MKPSSDRRRFVAMAQRAFELKKRVKKEDSNIPVIRPKQFDVIGIPQVSRCMCHKKVHFKEKSSLEKAKAVAIFKEMKRHKLGKRKLAKNIMITKILDHYSLFH